MVGWLVGIKGSMCNSRPLRFFQVARILFPSLMNVQKSLNAVELSQLKFSFFLWIRWVYRFGDRVRRGAMGKVRPGFYKREESEICASVEQGTGIFETPYTVRSC